MGRRKIPPSQRPERAGVQLDRELIVDTVRRVVRARYGPVLGACLPIATATASLLRHLDPGANWRLMGGSLQIACDVNDPTLCATFNCAEGGLHRGEFHAWVANPNKGLVDLSSRHFKQYVEQIRGVSGILPWTRPDPPDYIWCDKPSWVFYRVDPTTTGAIYDLIQRNEDDLMVLYNEVILALQG